MGPNTIQHLSQCSGQIDQGVPLTDLTAGEAEVEVVEVMDKETGPTMSVILVTSEDT
jgi:hypothetical protein